MKRSALLTLILIGAIATGAQAGDIFEKVGTFAGQFLKIGPSARGAAMGNAFSAVADDPSATYWNPAGLVEVQGTAIHIDHMEWPADIKLDYVSYVFKTSWVPGTLGLTARGLTMDPQNERTIYLPDGTGRQFDAGDMSFGFSYSQFFTDRFSTGATIASTSTTITSCNNTICITTATSTSPSTPITAKTTTTKPMPAR